MHWWRLPRYSRLHPIRRVQTGSGQLFLWGARAVWAVVMWAGRTVSYFTSNCQQLQYSSTRWLVLQYHIVDYTTVGEPTHNSHHLKRIIFYKVEWWDRSKKVQCKLQCIAIRLSLGFTPNSWWLLVPSSLLLAILSANRIHMEKPIQWLLCSVSFWYIWRF